VLQSADAVLVITEHLLHVRQDGGNASVMGAQVFGDRPQPLDPAPKASNGRQSEPAKGYG
jgi:hypothetical protein